MGLSREKRHGPKRGRSGTFTNPRMKPIVTKIYDFDDKNYRWIISELVKGFQSEAEWGKAVGVPSFYEAMDYVEFQIEESQIRNQPPEFDDVYKNSEFLNSLISVIKDTDLWVADLFDPGHWGKTADGRVVILDFGFTKEISRKFYD